MQGGNDQISSTGNSILCHEYISPPGLHNQRYRECCGCLENLKQELL
ncbi:hypothetical protein A2U01_0103140, partial [Trifolium medium]|nr:hypothetical protein [Trifolium medium]